MADLVVTDPNNVNLGVVPTSNVLTAGDRFPAEHGARYLLRINNGNAAPSLVVVDDPVSQAPAGSGTFIPDVDMTVVNATVRTMILDANRFRDANGWINFTAAPFATVSAEIYKI